MAASNTTVGITEGAGKLVGTRTVDSEHRQKVCIGGAEDGESYVFLPAHDAVDAGAPLKVGGYASLALPTAVSADGDRVNARFTREGALATVAAPVANKVWIDGQGFAPIQSATASGALNNATQTIVTSGGGSLRVHVTAIRVLCSAFTGAGYVTLRDGASTNIFPVCGITAVNTGDGMSGAGNGDLCYTTANTALQIFFSGNGTLIWTVTYYYAP